MNDVFNQHRLAQHENTLQGLRHDVQHLSERLDRLIALILPSIHRRPVDSIDTLSVLIHQLIERIGLAEEEASSEPEPPPPPRKATARRATAKRAPQGRLGAVVADELRMSLTWQNVLIGVVCVVAADLALAIIEMNVILPGWRWIYSALATGIAVLVWFAIIAQLAKRRT